jgi:myo-inositol-1(or 4)-monophosphatase
VVGVVYDPMRDELFHAEKGQGAFLNGRRVAVSTVDSLIRSLLATGFPYDRKESDKNNLDYFHDLLMASQEVRRDGSAALDLCSVAAGRFDGFWELKLKPWDVAAGSLIVTEAGGRITDLSGKPFDVRGDEVLASNTRIHEQMTESLRKAAARRSVS